LPRLQSFKARFPAELPFKYLTFAGPEGRDIEFFTSGHQIFSIQNVSVWEKSDENAKALGAKFGRELRIKQGEAFTLSSAPREVDFFPYSVINLDFTSGFFNLRKNRISPHNFELIQNLVRNQQKHACNFVLFLAFNVAPDVDGVQGQAFVHKMAFDIATRFGATKALFNLTRNAKGTYDDILSDLVPTAIIRLGGEHAFDTTCVGKAVYRPYGIRKSSMLCLSFEFWYDNPALSQSTHLVAQRMEEIISKRQQESLAVELVDINELRRPAGRGVSKSARARHRRLFAREKEPGA
jgi:hypothetical protein